jgi:uncharacterized membrane protein
MFRRRSRALPDGEAPPRLPWARLALPALTLAAVGFSIALFCQLVVMHADTRVAFMLSNTLGKPARLRLLVSLFAAMVVAVGLGLPLLLRRPRDPRRLERAADLLAPLALLFLFVPFFSLSWSANHMTYLPTLTLFVLVAEPLFRRSFAAARWWRDRLFLPRDPDRRRWWSRPWVPFVAVLAAGLTYGVVNSYYTILTHHRLGTSAFDLGIYDNLMFNMMHGKFFHSPVLFGPSGGNYLAGHAEFVMVLFVPLYAIRPGPETMLVIQSFTLGLAAVPLYLFGKTLLPRPTAAVVAVAYLFFAPLHGPNFYDFHWLPLAIFFHYWLYYAIARRKTWLVVVMVLILFSVREDVAVGVAVLGMFLLFTQTRPRLGIALTISAVAWFTIDRFVIMQLAGEWWFQNIYNDLFADGEATYGSVIKTILTNPVYFFVTLLKEGKLAYALHMLVPLAFIPIRRLETAMFILPGFFFTLMTSNYPPVIMTSFQYTTHWIPYLFLAVVIGLHLLEQRKGPTARAAAVATMALAVLVHSFCYGGLLQHERFQGGFSMISFKMSPQEQTRYADLRALTAMIPPTATVAATEQLTPHVSTRMTAYPLRWPVGAVDYIFVDRFQVAGTSQGPLTTAFAEASYGLVAERGGELYLFKHGPVTPGTDAALMALGIPVPPRPAAPRTTP